MILGTAGHIDHGKTALVRALTGVDTDRLPEEKRRGITIDLGFAPLELEGIGTVGIVDVPGHEAFIRTMLAGASGIDVALLVIAADEGVMPQTTEHLEILSLLDVRHCVVALTKCDLVDEDWLALQVDEVRMLISETNFAASEIVAVSSRNGSGIAELKDAISRCARVVTRVTGGDDLFRMPIDRAFTVKGTGTVVTGTIWSGHVARESILFTQPGSRSARVRGIEHHGQAATTAGPGQRTALALAGVDVSDLERGSVLVSDAAWVPTRELLASVDLTRADVQITPRTAVQFHLGTSGTSARLSIESEVSDLKGKRSVIARIHLSGPLLGRGGDRFVLRMPSPARTIGGGVVLDPYPEARKRGRKKKPRAGFEHESRDERSPHFQLMAILSEAGSSGVPCALLPIRTGLTPSNVASALQAVGALTLSSHAYAARAVTDLISRIERLVSDGVANHPLEAGVSLQTIRASAEAGDEVVEWALGRLVSEHTIDRSGSRVTPAGWKPKLGEAEQVLSDGIMHEICIQPSQPPGVAELVAKFGGKTEALLRKLEREGKLERVSDDRYYSSEVVAQLIKEMRSKLETGRIYGPAELREVLGVSRKYLIPFLEFCDRRGVTERKHEGRAVRPLADSGEA